MDPGHDAGVRYSGGIRPLHALMVRLRRRGMRPTLVPGPLPDVTIGLRLRRTDQDGLAEVEAVLDEWGSGVSDAAASIVPLLDSHRSASAVAPAAGLPDLRRRRADAWAQAWELQDWSSDLAHRLRTTLERCAETADMVRTRPLR